MNLDNLTDFEKDLRNSFKNIWLNEFVIIQKETNDLVGEKI